MPKKSKGATLTDLVRVQLVRKGIRYYQLADGMGISYNTLCRWMRRGLTDEEYTRARQAMREIEGRATP